MGGHHYQTTNVPRLQRPVINRHKLGKGNGKGSRFSGSGLRYGQNILPLKYRWYAFVLNIGRALEPKSCQVFGQDRNKLILFELHSLSLNGFTAGQRYILNALDTFILHHYTKISQHSTEINFLCSCRNKTNKTN